MLTNLSLTPVGVRTRYLLSASQQYKNVGSAVFGTSTTAPGALELHRGRGRQH